MLHIEFQSRRRIDSEEEHFYDVLCSSIFPTKLSEIELRPKSSKIFMSSNVLALKAPVIIFDRALKYQG